MEDQLLTKATRKPSRTLPYSSGERDSPTAMTGQRVGRHGARGEWAATRAQLAVRCNRKSLPEGAQGGSMRTRYDRLGTTG